MGLTIQPKMLGLALFLSLNVAVSAIVARRKGEGDRESANRVVRMCLLITLAMTAAVSALFVGLAGPIVKLVGSQLDTHDAAVSYLRIIMGGQVFNTVSLVLNAAQRGAGNTRIAMMTNLISNVVNVIFNYLLIGGNFGFPELGVEGAALATVLGTVCACALSIASVLRKDSFINLRAFKGWIPEKQSRSSIGNVWSSSLVEQVCLRIGFLLFSMTVARLGHHRACRPPNWRQHDEHVLLLWGRPLCGGHHPHWPKPGPQAPGYGENLRQRVPAPGPGVRLRHGLYLLLLWQGDFPALFQRPRHSGLWAP